jgi:NhaA family Na+:H+ antiporter
MARTGEGRPAPGGPYRRVWRPFQEFFQTESAGGILLLAAAVIALIWANVWPESYVHLWEEVFWSIGAPEFGLTLSLLDWINDGLMAIFFFLVGLEIKREVMVGELASIRKAALPLAAAAGGMIVPAGIYTIFTAGTPAGHGWGIPMATDIAFALGVLALLGDRVPAGLRIFLAALAIVDDLGAVLVIAFFYTAELAWTPLGVGLGVFLLLLALNRLGLRYISVYMIIGLVLWVAILLSGVHATIAGVLLALAVPSRVRVDAELFVDEARTELAEFSTTGGVGEEILTTEAQEDALGELAKAAEETRAPLARLEDNLSEIVAFGIVPLFALANAGVVLAGGIGAPYTWNVLLGSAVGLLAGKPIGIMLASWLAIRGGASAATGIGWRHLFGASLLAGIGFTMAIFIANLAFTIPDLLPAAKIGILIASPLAGLAGLTVLGTTRRTG